MNNLFKSILTLLLLSIGASQSFAEKNQKVTFYYYDLLGSPVATTDETGKVTWREEYSPWGEKLLKEDEAHDNVRGYTGHVNDKETGLTYMQARYYDPQIGRFMGVDPVGFKEGNTISFNRYGYANNNPFKFTDPNGEEPGSEDGDDVYNDTLATHTFDKEGISDFDRKAITYGNVSQASHEAKSFMKDVPDSRYSKEMNQLGAVFALGTTVATKGKIKPDQLKYAPRVRKRGLVDPKSHNFPYSFDKDILKMKPINKPNGYKMYQKSGVMTGKIVTDPITKVRTQQFKSGVFEIGVRKNGVIDHRFFRPDK